MPEIPAEPLDMMDVAQIAMVCHEANRAYCIAHGDLSQLSWTNAPLWQRQSAVAGVKGILSGAITSPEQSHAAWMADKLADGWILGPVKDARAMEHPALVPYADLPRSQKRKDALFYAIVRALSS